MFLPHPRVKVSIVGSLRDREVACSASDRQGANFESCVWRAVSSHSSHHPQEVLLAQFSLYVHKGGLKPDSFHFFVTALTLLDLSAAFVTIDHNTLTNRLAEWYGVSGMALAWFKSYLCGRHQKTKIDKSFSDSSLIEHGVPQGSVLGPLLFSLYTAPLSTIISSYGLSHLYADDTQIYISLTGGTATESLNMLQSCITGVSAWMAQSKLKLNPSKTEFLLNGSKSQREKFINLFPLALLDNEINPADSARNLGVFFDSGLTFVIKFHRCPAPFFITLEILNASEKVGL